MQWTVVDLCRLELDLQKIIFRAEDLVLAEERTTEADKELIMEGENIPIFQIVSPNLRLNILRIVMEQ